MSELLLILFFQARNQPLVFRENEMKMNLIIFFRIQIPNLILKPSLKFKAVKVRLHQLNGCSFFQAYYLGDFSQ